MTRWLAALALVVAALFVPTATAVAVPDPNTCTGYPEPRVWLEVQQWWAPPGSEDFGHVHLGACFPRKTYPDGSPVKVSGTVTIDVKVQMHDNPGRLDYVRLHLKDASGGNHQVFRKNIGETCPTTDCAWWVPVTFNSAISANDGYQNMRLAAIVTHPEHGGTKRFAGSSWQLYLNNGKPVRHDFDGDRIISSSWYTGALYGNAELRSPLPYTVSGTWSPQIRLDKGAGGNDVTTSFAAIDPAFHAVPPSEGQVLLDRAGPYSGPLPIDTTTLTNGQHKLFLRSGAPCDGSAGNDCGKKPDGSSNNVATSYSVEVVTFFVAN